MKFQNKVVLITGSSRGIGKATAKLYAKEGAKVVIHYKSSKEEAYKLYKELGKKSSIIVQGDVADETNVTGIVNEVMKSYGRIDVLINNAGAIIRPGDWKCDLKTWQKTIDINLTSVWLMIREVAPIMLKQKYGSIVNLSSTVGIRGVAGVMAYSCAKNGIISITKAFAKELAPYIRVNAVAPSNVNTDMTKSAGKELIELFKSQTPLKRIAEPEELANAIAFLASDDASYITGETLVVDGGHSLK